MYDIIPDIHGQAEKLKGTLTSLGYRERAGAWRPPVSDRMALFLGDFIDRGPANAEVIDIVRRMIDAGVAQAIMGNHELNAIHFHTADPETGAPLRSHSPKNLRQHGTFLAEFPFGSKIAEEVVAWMRTLPLFLEFDDFRLVHACWNDAKIKDLRRLTENGVLTEEQLNLAADKTTDLYELTETTTKGPETELPDGYAFTDKDGTVRHEVRVKWWVANPSTWADVAISVPDLAKLPNEPLPSQLSGAAYPANAKQVFFGHYWMEGSVELQALNALCLDYSAGKNGPLIAYRMLEPGAPIDLANIVGE